MNLGEPLFKKRGSPKPLPKILKGAGTEKIEGSFAPCIQLPEGGPARLTQGPGAAAPLGEKTVVLEELAKIAVLNASGGQRGFAPLESQ